MDVILNEAKDLVGRAMDRAAQILRFAQDDIEFARMTMNFSAGDRALALVDEADGR